jgi:hypothetical protein
LYYTTPGRLSYGKYFDLLIHRSCKIDNLVLRRVAKGDNVSDNYFEVVIVNTTCMQY